MKKYLSIMTVVLLSFSMLFFTSCEKDERKEETETEQIIFDGNVIGNGAQEFEIKGTHTLTKGVYLLKGWVYITDGATLTIEPGTVIKGDKDTKAALIVERGGKINANGTKDAPIVFTSAQPAGSRKPGDWGGIIICGRATNNNTEMIIEGGPRSSHGGNDDNDNSGTFRYVRIEFCGYPFKADQEINGLTMGSVGKGTKIEYVQISYSNDDAFEWFGGTVDGKYLIAYNTWDDSFDTDAGYSGRIQFGLAISNPRIADISRSNGFESDNNSASPGSKPITSPLFSNITLIGPVVQDAAFENTSSYVNGGSYNPNNGSKLGQHQSAFQIRRGSNLSVFNSVAVGYPVGLMINNDRGSQTQEAAESGDLKVKNVWFAGMTITGSDKDGSYVDKYSNNAADFDETKSESFSSTFFKKTENGNTLLANAADLGLKDVTNPGVNLNFTPLTSSPLIGLSELFTDPLLSDSFFSKVDFVGAFRSDSASDNWTAGWSNFDPQNALY